MEHSNTEKFFALCDFLSMASGRIAPSEQRACLGEMNRIAWHTTLVARERNIYELGLKHGRIFAAGGPAPEDNFSDGWDDHDKSIYRRAFLEGKSS